MFKTLRFICLGILISLLPACGIVPWYVSVAHTATDVVLYHETGKSSTEHLVSGATQKDCQFSRILDGAKVCMTKTEFVDYLLELNCEIIAFDFLGLPYCKIN